MGGIFADNWQKYAGLEWALFVLAKNDKVPAISGGDGFKSATTDTSILAEWASRYPGYNIGIATGKPSNIIVVDCDPRSGCTETRARLAKVGKVLPDTVEAQTCQGGTHLYYAHDQRVTAGGAHKLGRGLDVKTDGGYVVAPPSFVDRRVEKPGFYRWIRPPRGNALSPLPRWAIEMLKPKPQPARQPVVLPSPLEAEGYRRQALADLHELERMVSAMKDGRHEAPFRMACRLGKYRAHGFLSETEVEAALLNASANNGALSKYAVKDLAAQVKNGLHWAQKDALPPLARIHREP